MSSKKIYSCISNKRWSTTIQGSTGKIYIVAFGVFHKFKNIRNKDFSCNCPAYSYQKGYCKHIKYAIDNLHCGWYQEVDISEDDNYFEKCPKCGDNIYSYILH